jgi:hypothetical protein
MIAFFLPTRFKHSVLGRKMVAQLSMAFLGTA